MGRPAADHRRATAERNVAAILDATERLLARRTALSMAALATEAGLSRVTLYAHFAGLPQVVEATVERAVAGAMAAIEASDAGAGPADEALERLLAASWAELARQDAIARAAAEHVPPERLRRSHEPLLSALRDLVQRGQRTGAFRADLPADWLVTTFYALLHAAADHARAHRVKRSDALDMLRTTLRDVFSPRDALSAPKG
jgi:TetR/AcrR family transcriptional repressor of mexCD-oprJ operon